jgi:hypothetical protein|tara:strand:+ start:162 stop:797 length:636 start_codon:yes stop_codon:yes gene_type:complete
MTLDEEFEIIKEFIQNEEGVFKKPQKNATFINGDDKHLSSLKNTFIKSRNTKISITEPKTITDDALWEYIKLQKNLSSKQVNEFAKYHKIAMSIETKLGTLLESFIYKHINKYNWIWCSGSIVKDIDFINKNVDKDGNIEWTALQVKNSDNSENAASSRVRVGTNIKKWFRRLSTVKNKDNWNELAKIVKEDNKELLTELSEKNYLEYLKT